MPDTSQPPEAPMSDPEFDFFVSGPDLCALLDFHKATLVRLRQRGLPFVGSGRLRRYHVHTVLRWLSGHG